MTRVIKIRAREVALSGLCFGPEKPRRFIVFVHGLGGSAFSMLKLVDKLVDRKTAVLTFNNRGHDVISRVKFAGKRKGKPALGGAAHEKFTDCVDDINGAVRFAKKQGAKEIYLAGHSTGCQKSVYWAAKGGRGVKGIILLAPVSDYAAGLKQYGAKRVARASVYARALIATNKRHDLLPRDVWPETLDAQRFVSLYTPDGIEETFSYSQPAKNPALLKRVKVPLLVIWAEKEEYSSHPAPYVADWFSKHATAQKASIRVIKGSGHSFKRKEEKVARVIRRWLENA